MIQKKDEIRKTLKKRKGFERNGYKTFFIDICCYSKQFFLIKNVI